MKHKRFFFELLLLFLLLVGTGQVAAVEILYTAAGIGGDSTQLAEVDPNTGSVTKTFPVQQNTIIDGMAYDVSTDILFGTGLYNIDINNISAALEGLFSIDRNTGTFSQIGSAYSSFLSITGLAVHPITNVLYGRDLYGNLYTIDKTTGIPSLIGGAGAGINFAHGLAFAPTGELYASDTAGVGGTSEIFEIDLSNGLASLVATIGYEYVVGLDFSTDGTLFGSDNGTNSLIRIDLLSGTGTVVGPYADNARGHSSLAFVPSVPEPATLALVGLGVAAIGYRRKKIKAA